MSFKSSKIQDRVISSKNDQTIICLKQILQNEWKHHNRMQNKKNGYEL
ncbi:unnamed protein product [Paramecium pentaurelia]|uniref:Uncharacterized protein n=1 Tax=Paramecium pentaurelia TaxID=43138 RepID=A0A8S1YH23_9CILI|nr:unnamed protein product [Paramecium pentaurelia]